MKTPQELRQELIALEAQDFGNQSDNIYHLPEGDGTSRWEKMNRAIKAKRRELMLAERLEAFNQRTDAMIAGMDGS